MKKSLGLIALLAAAALSPQGAGAATVVPPPVSTLEILDVEGRWIDTTGGTGVRGLGTASVRWGIPWNNRGVRSGYDFDGVDDGTPQLPETDFVLGTFTHLNRVIANGTSITAARLQVSFRVRINDLTNGLSRLVDAQSTFDFLHWETPNDARPCADGGANGAGVNVNGCADRVTPVLNPAFSDTFRLGRAVYTLDITGFDKGDAFWTTEDAANRSRLFGRFTASPDLTEGESGEPPAPIPLPAAGWLMLAGLAGLGAAARRRR